jgi:hypothetical protein
MLDGIKDRFHIFAVADQIHCLLYHLMLGVRSPSPPLDFCLVDLLQHAAGRDLLD